MCNSCVTLLLVVLHEHYLFMCDSSSRSSNIRKRDNLTKPAFGDKNGQRFNAISFKPTAYEIVPFKNNFDADKFVTEVLIPAGLYPDRK